MRCLIIVFCVVLAVCNGQLTQVNQTLKENLHTGLTEKIGNFSVELLYYTTQAQPKASNLVISPITVWTILAVTAEGAEGDTFKQMGKALGIRFKSKTDTRKDYQDLVKWLQVKTTTVELRKVNALFMDAKNRPLKDFIDSAIEYDTRLIEVNFSQPELTASSINSFVSSVTHGRLSELVNSNDISNSNLVLTSALYFKGQWTIPFNSSFTEKKPFFDSTGNQLGEVNMMYARHTYPFANIKSLQARIIEIPYGKDNRLSMLIMLPYSGVSIERMFFNFNNVTLDAIFNQLKVSVEQFGDDEIDCYIPRFKIESNLELTNALKKMGIHDLFDERKASLPYMSILPVHVSRIIQKAEIEVTEEGTVASAATAAEFGNRIGAIKFEANRPFCYLIIEKVTNSITFGGFYYTPSLY